MKSLRIYKISDKYIRYLHSIDSKVQYNKHAKRPYIGVVFSFAGFDYFVPMESPKPNHPSIKSGKHILKIKNGEYGLFINQKGRKLCDIFTRIKSIFKR